jgi:hypothetical protein
MPAEQHHDETLVTFTSEMLVEFKKAYSRAVEVKCTRFIFDGRGYLTGYAKYLIEYLEEKRL